METREPKKRNPIDDGISDKENSLLGSEYCTMRLVNNAIIRQKHSAILENKCKQRERERERERDGEKLGQVQEREKKKREKFYIYIYI